MINCRTAKSRIKTKEGKVNRNGAGTRQFKIKMEPWAAPSFTLVVRITHFLVATSCRARCTVHMSYWGVVFPQTLDIRRLPSSTSRLSIDPSIVHAMNLAGHSDSEDEEHDEPVAKRPKREADQKDHDELPPLPASFLNLYSSSVRVSNTDDPSLHHGRKRVVKHVEGNWPTHVYLECMLNAFCNLRTELNQTYTASLCRAAIPS